MKISKNNWEEINRWEAKWWGDCANTYVEELKQLSHLKFMGLVHTVEESKVVIDVEGKRIVDIGGGVISLLLKCKNKGHKCTVVDPLLKKAPKWVTDRYRSSNILPRTSKAENFKSSEPFDEIWLYNVLQHVQDPESVLKNIRKLAPVIRIFEWLNTPPHEGHPHTITKEMIDQSLGIDLEVVKDEPEFRSGFRIAGVGKYIIES